MGNLDILLLNQSYVRTAMEDLLKEENIFSKDDQTHIVGLLGKAFTIGAQDTVDSVSKLGSDAKAVLVASQLEEAARRAATISPRANGPMPYVPPSA
jgi:hypothetical protein